MLIHGAAGGVGHLATQLARWRGAHVIGTATGAGVERARELGADEVFDRQAAGFEGSLEPVDLVLDTVGGEALARSPGLLSDGGRLICVAEEPTPAVAEKVTTVYFVVEPSRTHLGELGRLVDEGTIRPHVDSVFPLAAAGEAFDRVMRAGKRGKVVLQMMN